MRVVEFLGTVVALFLIAVTYEAIKMLREVLMSKSMLSFKLKLDQFNNNMNEIAIDEIGNEKQSEQTDKFIVSTKPTSSTTFGFYIRLYSTIQIQFIESNVCSIDLDEYSVWII